MDGAGVGVTGGLGASEEGTGVTGVVLGAGVTEGVVGGGAEGATGAVGVFPIADEPAAPMPSGAAPVAEVAAGVVVGLVVLDIATVSGAQAAQVTMTASNPL